MSFKAQLKIGSKEPVDIIACSYALHREVDGKGRPASIVYGGTIDLTIESTDDTSVIEAMVNNQHKPIDGTITFKKSDEDAKMKELSFEKGYVVRFAEAFDTISSKAMLMNFTISAQTIKIGGAEHKNDWPGGK
ncbi:MAG: type VI secretion system needle protein Hcp [Bacteroidetes bacterium]|nr:type VI secretion system needle protein Hcp [Bacteroidota bacterium]